MKVNIYETIEISDEQRVKLGRSIDGERAKKRQATRDEIKDFVWTYGAGWESQLVRESILADGGDPDPVPADDEDLLGDVDGDDLI